MLVSANHGLHGNRRGKARFTAFEAVEFLGKAGFEAVDVNFCCTTRRGLNHEALLDGDWRENIRRLRRELDRRGMESESTHAPRACFDEPREVYEELLRRTIEATRMLGAKYVVVHPWVNEDKTRTLTEKTIEYFSEFEAYAKTWEVTLAVENMVSTSPEQLLAIRDALDCGVCWDTGHANIAGRKQYESITTLGDALKVLHVHDNYGEKDLHNPPYSGTVDWEGFLAGLRDIGYQGALNFEVSADRIPEEARMEHAGYLVKIGRLFVSGENHGGDGSC